MWWVKGEREAGSDICPGLTTNHHSPEWTVYFAVQGLLDRY